MQVLATNMDLSSYLKFMSLLSLYNVYPYMGLTEQYHLQ